jgi:hypothetical protein
LLSLTLTCWAFAPFDQHTVAVFVIQVEQTGESIQPVFKRPVLRLRQQGIEDGVILDEIEEPEYDLLDAALGIRLAVFGGTQVSRKTTMPKMQGRILWRRL